MSALPVTTQCYAERLTVLQARLEETLASCHSPECSRDLAVCFEREARSLYASIWAMHAEVEED